MPWAAWWGSRPLSASCPCAHALDPERSITQYARGVWRAPLSLPHDSVTAIVQSRDGYLWLGTIEGLARFDGVRSVVFDKSNTPAFADNWVKALVEDRTGRIWIGTLSGGLVCRDGLRFTHYGPGQGIAQEGVLALLQDRAGRIWAGTAGGGVLRLEGERFIREPGTEATSASSVRALLEGRDGSVWIGADNGLYRFREGALTRLTRAEGLTDNAVISLAEDDEGLWIGTEHGGLDRLVAGRLTSITTREGLAHERVWSLAVDRDQALWIGTDGGGLQRLSAGRLATLSTANGLTNDFVWAIREDREGSLWVGTNGGGLSRLRIGRVTALTTHEGLPGDFVRSIHRTRDGSLWVGTEDAGLARIRDGRAQTFTTRDGLSGKQLRALAESKDGSLWIGGDTGVDRWRDGRITGNAIAGLPPDRITALAEDGSGTLWIGTGSSGVAAAKGGKRLSLSMAEGLPGSNVNFLLAARDGSVWVGTASGLARLKSGQVTRFSRDDGLPGNYVTSLFEDPDGGVWVATRSGLARIRDGQVRSLRSGLLYDDAIMSAVLGDDGGIWMGGNRGLSRVGRREVEEVMAGRRATLAPLVLGLEDGMPHQEVNGSGSARWKDVDGRLWFATRGGVASVDPSRLSRNVSPAPVLIEEVVADGQVLEGKGGWRLPAGTRRVGFQFTALALAAPSRLRFARRLDGFDSDWVETGPRRSVDYTNLPHGQYRFRVKAANEDGLWNESGAEVTLEIEPRFYERLWVRALVALAFVVAGPSFYLVRVRTLRRQKQALERVVAARTAELEAANTELARLSREDSLTGVANRRRLDEALEEEWRRARRESGSLAFLLLDVDDFKEYNDRQGHPAGDACLKTVAQTVTSAHRRAGELVARYGGEEFAVLMPGLSREAAQSEAESVRRLIEELGLPHQGSRVGPVVTVSVGLAWAEPRADGAPADLVEAADRALYRAKQAGRNRVAIDDEGAAPFAS